MSETGSPQSWIRSHQINGIMSVAQTTLQTVRLMASSHRKMISGELVPLGSLWIHHSGPRSLASQQSRCLRRKRRFAYHHCTAGSTNHSLRSLFYILSSTMSHCMDPAFCKQLPNSQSDYHKSQSHDLCIR